MDELDLPDLPVDEPPEHTAERAGLRYVSDEEPGYRRKPWGRGFTYLDAEEEHVQDEALRARFKALAIPPAWTDVWICAREDGHLQATGRDEAGRKQYRYHPDWEAARNAAKYTRLVPFGGSLPDLRRRCEADLQLEGLPQRRVLAAVVTLLDRTALRIGNPAYARTNASYGLTTLRDRHVAFSKSGCTFRFAGKHGKDQEAHLDDPRLAELVRACRDVPGYDLFQYIDESGERGTVRSDDVNAYLREAMEAPFTAKDFRTWHGTLYAAADLVEADDADADPDAAIRATIEATAERLGNTPAVCRDYYLHPAVLEAFRAGTLAERWHAALDHTTPAYLHPEEHALLRVLADAYGT